MCIRDSGAAATAASVAVVPVGGGLGGAVGRATVGRAVGMAMVDGCGAGLLGGAAMGRAVGVGVNEATTVTTTVTGTTATAGGSLRAQALSAARAASSSPAARLAPRAIVAVEHVGLPIGGENNHSLLKILSGSSATQLNSTSAAQSIANGFMGTPDKAEAAIG